MENKISGGCFASHKITKEKNKIGYMYREKPSETFDDSGWRFFAGNESEEYCNDSKNFDIYNLSTIAEIDSTILQYLNLPIGTKLELNKSAKK